jgi:hypothetical protein
VEQGEWHTIHALPHGCCACHGGNDHTADQSSAHIGLIQHPLNIPEASCQQCHPADYQPRAAEVSVRLGLVPERPEPTAGRPVAATTSPPPTSVTLLPRTSFRGWDWPVELAVGIVALGLGVMRWRRVHTS